MTNGTGIAWMLLLIQQPDGNALKSGGGKRFASRIALRSSLSPMKACGKSTEGVARATYLYFREMSGNVNLQALPLLAGMEESCGSSPVPTRVAPSGNLQPVPPALALPLFGPCFLLTQWSWVPLHPRDQLKH